MCSRHDLTKYPGRFPEAFRFNESGIVRPLPVHSTAGFSILLPTALWVLITLKLR